MTTTATRPPSTGLALWWAIPGPVRTALRARVPLDCRGHNLGDEFLIVAVGSGVPLTWLQIAADATGKLTCRLFEVRQRNREIASGTTTADGLTGLLQQWAKLYNLGA